MFIDGKTLSSKRPNYFTLYYWKLLELMRSSKIHFNRLDKITILLSRYFEYVFQVTIYTLPSRHPDLLIFGSKVRHPILIWG